MMIPSEMLSIIGRRHFIAEIRTETATQAIGAVEALARGGIGVFEISLAIPGAEEILHHYASNTELLVGAGGVTEPQQVTEAATAGARFIVSPIMAPELIPPCNEQRITPILGALTPTEIIQAQRAGAEMIKIFPVSAVGGSQYIRSLFRQFTYLSLMIGGGISMENLPDYLSLPVRSLALGSVLTPRALIERGDWGTMTAIARQFVEYAAAWDAAAGGVTPRVVPNGKAIVTDTVMAPVTYTPNFGTSQPAMPPMPYPQPQSQPNISRPYVPPPTLTPNPALPSRSDFGSAAQSGEFGNSQPPRKPALTNDGDTEGWIN